MQVVKVMSGVLSMGQGDAMLLTADQVGPRRHNLAKCEKVGDVFLAEARAGMQFKAGEVIGASHVAKAFAEKVRAATLDDGEVAGKMLAAVATLVCAPEAAPEPARPAARRR
jgi:hypothetical protein